MYAELLEMTEDTHMAGFDIYASDGVPQDIDLGWVAVAPVPVGKRCLAITHAPSGIAGVGEQRTVPFSVVLIFTPKCPIPLCVLGSLESL